MISTRTDTKFCNYQHQEVIIKAVYRNAVFQRRCILQLWLSQHICKSVLGNKHPTFPSEQEYHYTQDWSDLDQSSVVEATGVAAPWSRRNSQLEYT